MSARRLLGAPPVALALLVHVAPAAAQRGPRITVPVRQVAGATLYLDVGTRHGLATGDTLSVALDSLGAAVGRLVVTASADTRSVLTYVDAPFDVERGAPLTLFLLREPVAEVPRPEPAAPSARPVRLTPGAGTGAAHGRMALDLSAVRSSTRVGGADPIAVDRTMATPAFRFDATVPDAVGGFALRTGFRLAYRYSDVSLSSPTTSVRVYAAALERRSERLHVVLGRFHSPAETYSGFWDGAMVRVGPRSAGVGALVGFQPDRWNEAPSGDLSKVSVFADGARSGDGWRWRGDVSAHVQRPAADLPRHTFVGVSQRLSVGRLSLSEDLQVDRDPSGGPWRVSRLRVRGSLALGGGLVLRAAAARREGYLALRSEQPFAPRVDRLQAGLTVRVGRGHLGGDVSTNREADGTRSHGVTASFGFPTLLGRTLGLSGTASRWTGPRGSALSAAPTATLAVGRARLRLGYRLYRSDFLSRTLRNHAVEAALDAPVGQGLRFSGALRGRLGGSLRSETLRLTLYRVF